jgi:hypothetical protein
MTAAILVVPPWTDLTLAYGAAEVEVVDLNRELAAELLDPRCGERAAAELQAAVAVHPDSEKARRLLLLRAGLELLALHPGGLRSYRAAGAVLAGLTGGSDVRLGLDDLHFAGGTLQASDEAVRAARAMGSLASVLDRWPPAVGRRVDLWIERDQQLPAAIRLARRLGERVPVRLAGPYAWRHRAVLEPLLAAEVLPPALLRPRALVAGAPWERPPTRTEWREDGSDSAEAWSGRLPLARLAELGGHDWPAVERCRCIVTGFAALDSGAVIAAEGDLVPLDRVLAARERLEGVGAGMVAEWWIGAPGVGLEALERTLEWLARERPFTWVAGLRVFTWPAERDEPSWGGLDIRLLAPPAELDLARDRPFEAASTLDAAGIRRALEWLAPALASIAPLAPGRLAAAYHCQPVPPPAGGSLLGLDPDCAVVQLPCGLDCGGPCWYAANLRTGAVSAVDARLAPGLRALRRPRPSSDVLAVLPAERRVRVINGLLARAVLAWAG